MSLVDIQVVGLENAIGNLQQAEEIMDNLGEGLLEAVDSVLMPAIEEASATVWNVRSWKYKAGWYSYVSDPNMVTIRNSARSLSDGFPYANSLEYGWTTRNGGFVDSPGVAIPVTLELAGAIGEGLADWLKSQLPQ